MRSLLLALSILWFTSSVSLAQQKQADVATRSVVNAVEQLRLAMIDPTEARLSALVADSLTYGHSNGKVENKAEFIQALLSGESDFKTITLSNQHVTVVDNVALVRHGLQAETLNKGVAGTASLSVLLVWVYGRGSWKLLARQAVKQ